MALLSYNNETNGNNTVMSKAEAQLANAQSNQGTPSVTSPSPNVFAEDKYANYRNTSQNTLQQGNAQTFTEQQIAAQDSKPPVGANGVQGAAINTRTAPDTNAGIKANKPITNQWEHRTPYQIFRDNLYDEDKLHKQSHNRAKVLAIGDALRHLGNLYYTSNGAVPQNLGNVSPAEIEKNSYDKSLTERDARAYRLYSSQLQAENTAADREYKKQMLGINMAKAQSAIDSNEARRQKDLFTTWVEKQKFPYTIEKAAKEAYAAEMRGDKTAAEAKMKQMEAGDVQAAGLVQARLNEINSRTNKNNAKVSGGGRSVSQSGTSGASSSSGGNNTIEGYYGTMSRTQRKGSRSNDFTSTELTNIYEYGVKNGWITPATATSLSGKVTNADRREAINKALVKKDAKSQKLTDHLISHYGYGKPQTSSNNNGSSVFNAKTKTKTQKTAKSKNTKSKPEQKNRYKLPI